jgi:hypothetical protein
MLCGVLYGYKAWFLTLREEHILRGYVNSRLRRRIFGHKRVEELRRLEKTA